MAKVYMTCGRICSGKSTFAKKLSAEKKAVILSVDEITLTLLGREGGELLDVYVEKLEEYFFRKSVEIARTGINVILDWGFWTRSEREYARRFYSLRGIEYEMYYIDLPDSVWFGRIAKRNEAVRAGLADEYYVDAGLAEKAGRLFEKPADDEDVIVVSTL